MKKTIVNVVELFIAICIATGVYSNTKNVVYAFIAMFAFGWVYEKIFKSSPDMKDDD